MSPRKIDDHFRDYYESREPSPEVMARLLEISSGATSSATARRAVASRRWVLLSAAATIAIAVLAGVILFSKLDQHQVRPGVGAPVALAKLGHEAADRHRHCATTEFTGSDFGAIAAQMERLDFEPVVPSSDELAGLTVAGGHYCMLDGRMALHVYLTDRDGSKVSILEVRAPNTLTADRDVRQSADGLQISLSVSRSVVLAFVRGS